MRIHFLNILNSTLIILVFILYSLTSYSAEISVVKGKKAMIVKAQGVEQGLTYNVLDKNDRIKGLVKILKIKKDKALGQIVKGSIKKGFRLELDNSFSDFKDDFKEDNRNSFFIGKTIRSYLGLAMSSDLPTSPMLYGADYLYPFEKVITLRAGAMYWALSNNNISYSLIEISGGPFYSHNLTPKWELEVGVRIGFSKYSFSSSGTSITIISSGAGMYNINKKMQVGGEFRYPYFLSDVDFKGFYLMGVFSYKL